MVCHKLQLSDYFRLTKAEYSSIKYRGARFKTYQYGWLDKVMSISESKGSTSVSAPKIIASYDHHVSGQIATASIYSKDERPFVSTYDWDGLALIKRGTTSFTNEPAVTGGNPILATNSTKDTKSIVQRYAGDDHRHLADGQVQFIQT